MQGNPPTSGYGSAPNEGGPHPPGGVVPPHHSGLPPGGAYALPQRQRPSRLPVALATLAVLLAGAALVVSLVREPKAPAPPPPAPPQSQTVDQEIFNDEADRPLCEAIAPLMRENDDQTRAFSQHKAGTPEQISALVDYRKFMEDWAPRAQAVVNEHADPPRYLTRMLQRFIDDMLLYVGLKTVSDEVGVNTWKLSLTDYNGPASVCERLGEFWR